MDFHQLARLLVAWHDTHQRELPWRNAPAGARDPYAVWISEVMAQQTRLEVVAGYYTRWMERFPTIAALAQADLQAVLKQWEGLGYYARARNLHKAAQTVVARHGGRLPASRHELLALPGIGPYTVGAIRSIAFNAPEPLLDGNVKRIFSRLVDISEPIDDPAVEKRLWQMAADLVQAADPASAGACNEAVMELGALICIPGRPRCPLCPVAHLCRAAAHGTQAARPVRRPRRRTPHYDVAAGVIWQAEPWHSPLLLAQRPADGMLGGLWEFPGGKLEPHDADLPACLRREIREELGIEIDVGAPVVSVPHAYTHFRITLHAFHARHRAGAPQPLGCADWRWVTLSELDAYPLPVTDRKVLAALHRQSEQLGWNTVPAERPADQS